jgi:type IV fimbrial biogenesis protein FimT
VKQIGQKGFSLVEVLITIGILVILAAIAMPQTAQLIKNYRLNSATRTAWSDMQNARMTAIKENRSIRVDFGASSYSFAGTGTAFTRDLSVIAPNVTISSSGGSITFNSRGMADPTTITVSLSGSQRRFTIAWTGRIQGI